MNRYRHIKSLLVRQGISFTELAQELGCTRENISGVVRGSWASREVQEHIAKRLGCDFNKLWGTWASTRTSKAA